MLNFGCGVTAQMTRIMLNAMNSLNRVWVDVPVITIFSGVIKFNFTISNHLGLKWVHSHCCKEFVLEIYQASVWQ